MTHSTQTDIAIIGAGFSGLMTLYHLVHLPQCPRHISIVDPAAFGRGPAYTTKNTHHLLNVRAKGMSALADQPKHFLDWLNSAAGQSAAQALNLAPHNWQDDDFAPRALYARYLDDLKAHALQRAQQKGIRFDYINASADAITRNGTSLTITLSNGSTLNAARCLLALGNLPQTTPAPSSRVVSRVWDFNFSHLANSEAPVAIIGAGLTMVDIVIALRDAGYRGTITALSRNGWLPHTHDMRDAQLITTAGTLAQAPQRLRTLFSTLRREIRAARAQGLSWQTAMDHWRPYLPTLWSQMPADDRRRFLTKYFTLWGIHRHRMAPAIGARIADERRQGTLDIRAGGARITEADDQGATITTQGNNTHFAWVFDCRGPGYNLMTSDNVLLKQMARDGLLAADATGWGVAVEDDLKVSGQQGLYAIGPLAIGARLETTAVPELRGQAQAIAATLAAT